MSSKNLRPGFIETQDIRDAIEAVLGSTADSQKLAERLLAEPALVEVLNEANGRVETAEREAQQAALDKVANVAEAFLRTERLR